MCVRAGRRLICLLACFCLCLTGCQGAWRAADRSEAAQGKLQVVTTIFPYYDFARQVAGEYADVSMMVPAGMDTHSFEPTARDMVRLGDADVFLYNGGELESWVPRVLDAVDNDHWMVDQMMDYVDVFTEEHVEGMKGERGHSEKEHGEKRRDSERPGNMAGDEEDGARDDMNGAEEDMDGSEEGVDRSEDEDHEEQEELDEHIWTSPVNASILVRHIAEDLGNADPAHRKEYQLNAEHYAGELERLDREFRNVTESAQSRYLVFGDRFPLRYFVEEYGLEYTAAFVGCSSDTEPSADTIAYLTDQVRRRRLPIVLKIELTSDRIANAIAEAAGAEVETFHTCHNVTRGQLDDGVTYLSLMEQNISVLKDTLVEK